MKIKQDINFFDKPLWFLNKSSNQSEKIWEDIDGYLYRAAYKLPDKVDMLILFYMLLKSQELGYQEKLTFSRYQIIKSCGLPLNKNSYDRLKDSLERWLNVSIKFSGTFYEHGKYTEIGFHIVDSYKIDEEDKRLEVQFSPFWLTKIKESKFFKYVDFNHYKALKRAISRRLFELLSKSFQGRDKWEIDLVKLGTKLTLSKRKIKKRGKELEVMYHSDVLVKVKVAINEINKFAENEKLTKSLELGEFDIFRIDYELKEGNKIIIFHKRKPEWLLDKKKKVKGFAKEAKIENEAKEKLKAERSEKAEEELQKLFLLCKSKGKTIRTVLERYYEKEGFDYIRWNLLYANEKAKKNYAAFLKKALKENWGEDYKEEEEEKVKAEDTHRKEKQKQVRESLEVHKEIERLNKIYESLPQKEKDSLLEDAKSFYINTGLSSDFIMPKEMLLSRIRETLKIRGC